MTVVAAAVVVEPATVVVTPAAVEMDVETAVETLVTVDGVTITPLLTYWVVVSTATTLVV